jgi:hypothetical protein
VAPLWAPSLAALSDAPRVAGACRRSGPDLAFAVSAEAGAERTKTKISASRLLLTMLSLVSVTFVDTIVTRSRSGLFPIDICKVSSRGR